MAQPDIEEGIEYWKAQPASLDGVLGGYGTGVSALSISKIIANFL